MADLEEQGRAIAIMILKARQLGMSTGTEIAVGHRPQFYPQVNATVASSDPDKSALMAKMMELCWDHMPWFLMPVRTRYKVGELIEYGRQNSGSRSSTAISSQASAAVPPRPSRISLRSVTMTTRQG
jgi:hypothetical protein